MTTRITILGAGPGGYIAAIRAAQLGASVTIIENNHVGGTCLNWGCIPTKTLKSSAEAMDVARRLSDFGINTEGKITPDIESIVARKDHIVKTQIKGIDALLKSNGVNLVKGRGTVLSPTKVRVECPERGSNEVMGDKLILATGSEIMRLPDFPFDGEQIISSDEALFLKEIPKDILIVGGGVIGAEFGFILNAFGSNVTVVEALDRILPIAAIDADTSKCLQREMKKRKIKFYVNSIVAGTKKTEDGRIKAIIEPSPFLRDASENNKKPVEVVVDKLLICIGRSFRTSGIGLKNIGLKLDAKGWIPVNDRMETNIPGVYAIGDVLGPSRIMLAHVASAEALIAAENCMGGSREMDYRVVPNGIFTFPEIGSVGISEQQAIRQGLSYRTDSFYLRGLGKAQATGELAGQVKLLSNPNDGQILGIHIIGAHATELVAEAALAMKLGATVRELAETIHLHPSLSEGLRETAHMAIDESLHALPLKKRSY